VRVTILSTALGEGVGAREWFRQYSTESQDAFSRTLQESLERIGAFPEMAPANRRGFRRLPIRGYPYSIVYRIENNAVVVVAIAHASREPGYWEERR